MRHIPESRWSQVLHRDRRLSYSCSGVLSSGDRLAMYSYMVLYVSASLISRSRHFLQILVNVSIVFSFSVFYIVSFYRKRAACITGHPFGIAGIAPRFSRGLYFSAICSTLQAGMVNLIPACTFSTPSKDCTTTFSGSSKVFFACISWVTI